MTNAAQLICHQRSDFVSSNQSHSTAGPPIALPPTKVSECPSPATLAELSSGALEEAEADKVFAHVDECEFCQAKLDHITVDQENVVAKATRLAKGKPSGHQLSQLIKKAQTLTQKKPDPESPSKGISVDSFVAGLRRCGLFDDSQVDALISDVKSEDSSSMARELVSRHKLTQFQARALLKGRWKGLVLGNYEILKKLGQGGMGSVFRAKHKRLGRIVCVKVMNQAGRKSQSMLDRFRNEARTIAALSHPNFIVAHDADEAEGVPFLAMEFVDGDDLAKHVTANGPLKVPDALEIVRQAAEAMQYAHNQGVTHRDIKPHNIMLTPNGDTGNSDIKILDLGLARFDSVLNDDDVDAGLRAAMTNTGVIMGTVDYMSPEQALRSRDADNRSDIYSLGCTLHYLLTGTPIFDGDTVMARLVAHREQVVPSLEEKCFAAMPYLDAVFYKMVAKDPALRYQSMAEVASEVTALLAGQLPTAAQSATRKNESVLRSIRSKRQRTNYRPWVAMGFVFCLACLGVWVVNSGLFAQPPKNISRTTIQPPAEISTDTGPFSLSMKSGFNFQNAETIANGGDGVALIVLPFEDPNLSHLLAWEEALKETGVDVRYASSESGQTTAKSDYDLPVVQKLGKNQVTIDCVDMILFVGGSQDGFKSPAVHEQLLSLVDEAMPQGVILGNFADSEYAAVKSVVDLCNTSGKSGSITIRSPFAQEGVYLEIDPPKNDPNVQIRDAVNLVSMAIEHRKNAIAKRDSLDRFSFYKKLNPNQLRKNWGPGRALVVLPFQGYDFSEWKTLNSVLKEGKDEHEQVEILVTSSRWGEAVDSRGKSPVPVDIMMDQFSADEFDYVVFISGDTSDFEEDHELGQLKAIVQQSVDAGLILVAASDQAGTFYDSTNVSDCLKNTKHGVYRIGECRNGTVALAAKPVGLWKLFGNLPAVRDKTLGKPVVK